MSVGIFSATWRHFADFQEDNVQWLDTTGGVTFKSLTPVREKDPVSGLQLTFSSHTIHVTRVAFSNAGGVVHRAAVLTELNYNGVM